jgi:hypothetical protein
LSIRKAHKFSAGFSILSGLPPLERSCLSTISIFLQGAPISAYNQYKTHGNSHYLKELGSLRTAAFTDSNPNRQEAVTSHKAYKAVRHKQMKTMAKDLVSAEKEMKLDP